MSIFDIKKVLSVGILSLISIHPANGMQEEKDFEGGSEDLKESVIFSLPPHEGANSNNPKLHEGQSPSPRKRLSRKRRCKEKVKQQGSQTQEQNDQGFQFQDSSTPQPRSTDNSGLPDLPPEVLNLDTKRPVFIPTGNSNNGFVGGSLTTPTGQPSNKPQDAKALTFNSHPKNDTQGKKTSPFSFNGGQIPEALSPSKKGNNGREQEGEPSTETVSESSPKPEEGVKVSKDFGTSKALDLSQPISSVPKLLDSKVGSVTPTLPAPTEATPNVLSLRKTPSAPKPSVSSQDPDSSSPTTRCLTKNSLSTTFNWGSIGREEEVATREKDKTKAYEPNPNSKEKTDPDSGSGAATGEGNSDSATFPTQSTPSQAGATVKIEGDLDGKLEEEEKKLRQLLDEENVSGNRDEKKPKPDTNSNNDSQKIEEVKSPAPAAPASSTDSIPYIPSSATRGSFHTSQLQENGESLSSWTRASQPQANGGSFGSWTRDVHLYGSPAGAYAGWRFHKSGTRQTIYEKTESMVQEFLEKRQWDHGSKVVRYLPQVAGAIVAGGATLGVAEGVTLAAGVTIRTIVYFITGH